MQAVCITKEADIGSVCHIVSPTGGLTEVAALKETERYQRRFDVSKKKDMGQNRQFSEEVRSRFEGLAMDRE